MPSNTKYNIKKLEHMSDVLKAVAHPLRIGIVDVLLKNEELSVNSISKLLGIDQPEASRQLKTLKQAGLIQVRKKATSRYYSVVDKNISQLLSCVENCTV